MSSLIGKIQRTWVLSDGNTTKVLKQFRLAIYIFLLYNMVVMTLPNAIHYWGEESLMRPWKWEGSVLFKFQYLMMNDWLNKMYVVLIILHIGSLIYGVYKGANRWVHIVIFITTLWLYGRLYLYVIGGNQLVQMLMFYLLFADEKSTGSLQKSLNHWILLACQIQICFVYFFSGLYKLAGEDWIQGKAMFYILQVEEYSHPILMNQLLNLKWVTSVMTYSALIYQLSFPFLIWVKRVKKPLLVIGIIFHLFIGLAMGVWDFALVMIAAYAVFWDWKKT